MPECVNNFIYFILVQIHYKFLRSGACGCSIAHDFELLSAFNENFNLFFSQSLLLATLTSQFIAMALGLAIAEKETPAGIAPNSRIVDSLYARSASLKQAALPEKDISGGDASATGLQRGQRCVKCGGGGGGYGNYYGNYQDRYELSRSIHLIHPHTMKFPNLISIFRQRKK
jgi:hypothetical protein